MAERRRVLIVDDNPLIRVGLRLLVDGADDLHVVAEACNGQEALERAAEYAPDVVLLDVRMPVRGGLEVLPELSQRACVIMLTSSDEDETIRAAMGLGARGYLVYGSMDEFGILQSIRTALGGGAVLSGQAAAALLSGPPPTAGPNSQRATPERVLSVLSEREIAVMDLLAAGKSNGEIAQQLFLAPKTVKNHVNRIFAKLHVVSRAQAMALWLGSALDEEVTTGSVAAVPGPARRGLGPDRGPRAL